MAPYTIMALMVSISREMANPTQAFSVWEKVRINKLTKSRERFITLLIQLQLQCIHEWVWVNVYLHVPHEAAVICIQCKRTVSWTSLFPANSALKGQLRGALSCSLSAVWRQWRHNETQSGIIKRPAFHILFPLHHSVSRFLKLFRLLHWRDDVCERATAAMQSGCISLLFSSVSRTTWTSGRRNSTFIECNT